MKKLLIAFLLGFFVQTLAAQSTFIPYNRDYYHLIDRFQIKYGNSGEKLKTTFKPIRRIELADFLNQISAEYESMSAQDQFNYEFLMNDSWYESKSKFNENPKNWWNLAYEQKSDLYVYQTEDFLVRINPVFTFTGGIDQDETNSLYLNTRGAEAQGIIDNKIGFYTMFTTTEGVFADYVRQSVITKRAFPNEGYWKTSAKQYDLTQGRGYITFGLSKSIDVQAGYDKRFIGNGLRSMVFSDFSNPSLFGQINFRSDKFNYHILHSELTADIIFANSLSPGDGRYPKKFFTYHRLGVQLFPNFELGLFESIVSQKADLNYFNPLIFYRAVEQQLGSPDNVLLGVDFQYNVKSKVQLYGQFILDELVISALRSGNGDWRNKFGIQLGAKYIDAFDVANLDLQAEVNLARPYLYASDSAVLSYTHYRNPLAHPFGANFKELALAARYQPTRKVFISSKFIRTIHGEDDNNLNYGGNLLASTNDRIDNLGNEIGQGVGTNTNYLELTGSYMLLHNVFLDWKNILRKKDSAIDSRSSNTFITMLSLRWNIAQREHEF